MKLAAWLLISACLAATLQAQENRPNYWSATRAGNAGWRPQGASGMLPSSAFGASYGFGAPYNSFGAAYGSGSPYFGLGGGYGGGYGGYRYGNYLATTYGGNSAATGSAARFYYGAPGGNGGFGYGPGGYGNNDNSTYRYRGTSALPPVPGFDNYAQPSPLVPYSYIYANQRTPQAPAHPETISNPFVSQADAQEAPQPMPPVDEPPQRKAE